MLQTIGQSLKKLLWQAVLTLLLALLLLWQLNGVIKITLPNLTELLFPASTATVEVRNLILGGLTNTNELVTANMSTKATVKVQKERKFSRFSLGNTNLIYEGVGRIQAGIDISKLEAKEVDREKQKIHIILPPAHLSEVFLDINSSNAIDRYKRWWGPNVEAELEEEAQKKALQIIKAEACTERILATASDRAKTLVEEILTKAGYQEIIVETQIDRDNLGC
jgi:hypothetical protein